MIRMTYTETNNGATIVNTTRYNVRDWCYDGYFKRKRDIVVNCKRQIAAYDPNDLFDCRHLPRTILVSQISHFVLRFTLFKNAI